jgi:hypothetical protein
MHPYVIPLTLYLVFLMCALFAYREGELAERLGAVWLGCNSAVGAILLVLGQDTALAHLIADGVFAIGLLPLAMIFVSYWIGLVTFVAAALFTLEAMYLLNDRPVDLTYAWINNILWIAVPLIFLSCGLTNYLKRRRAARSAPALAASAALG